MRFLLATTILFLLASIAFSQEVVTKTTPVTEFAEVLEAHKGRPLLVNVWATWCGPCRVEFPDIVKVSDEFRGKGLDAAIVSLDNIGAIDFGVHDFLESYESKMTSYLFDGKPDALYRQIRKIAPKAPPGVPLTLLLDKSGRVVYVRSGVVNADVLRANVWGIIPRDSSGR